MSEREALLRGVLAAPDDDLPRLVLADWLEENGDESDRARAEFIRAQVALAPLGPDDERRPALEAAERRLRKRHDRSWMGEARGWLDTWHYERGFVAGVACDAYLFLSHREELWTRFPVRGLHLHRARDREVLDRVGRCPELGRLQALDLSGNPAHQEAVRGLFDSRSLGGLAALRFNDNPLGFDAVRVVADSPELAGLRELELRRNNLTDETVLALADSPYLTGLRVLDLRGNAVGERARRELQGLFGAGVVRF